MAQEFWIDLSCVDLFHVVQNHNKVRACHERPRPLDGVISTSPPLPLRNHSNVLQIRRTRTLIGRVHFLRGRLPLTVPNNYTDLLQPDSRPLLSDKAGGRESRSSLMGTLLNPFNPAMLRAVSPRCRR